jgi:succinate dehydrogenase/fumarate reductase cytochrome b subunit
MAVAAQSMGREDAARERRWGRIQAASGLTFGVFVALHLLNQWLAPLGPAAYDGFQAAARAVYQHPAVEIPLIALPLLVHVVAGLRRMQLAGLRGRGGRWRMRLHRITGYVLLTVIFGHVLAVRGPSLFYDFFPGFAGVSFSLWWMPAWFGFYYTVFGASALYHGINGTLLALLAFGGRLFPIADPTQNDYARMWEALGVDLTR